MNLPAEMLTYPAEREIAWVFLPRMATLKDFPPLQNRLFRATPKATKLGLFPLLDHCVLGGFCMDFRR